MPRQQPLGLELIAQTGGSRIAQGELLTEQGVFRALELVELEEAEGREGGKGGEQPGNPAQRGGGGR